MSDEIDHESTYECVCPYCGDEVGDSWELADSGEIDCDKCEKKFMYESEAYRTFTSRKVPCLNGEPHVWKPVTMHDYPKARRCQICRFYDWKGVK